MVPVRSDDTRLCLALNDNNHMLTDIGYLMPPAKSSAQKQAREFKTYSERKLSHVAAEKKRREAIRRGFDQITAVVPELDPAQSRSEAVVLEKTLDLIKNLIQENEQLRNLANEKDLEIPPRLE